MKYIYYSLVGIYRELEKICIFISLSIKYKCRWSHITIDTNAKLTGSSGTNYETAFVLYRSVSADQPFLFRSFALFRFFALPVNTDKVDLVVNRSWVALFQIDDCFTIFFYFVFFFGIAD